MKERSRPRQALIADISEPADIPQLLKGIGFDVRTMRMTVGDYLWQCLIGLVIVERKTVEDLLGSIGSGRLHRQLAALIETAALPILLVEGELCERRGKVESWRGNKPQSAWDYDGVMNYLLAWQLAGVYLTFSPSASYTPFRLASLYEWSQKPEHLPPRRERLIPGINRLSGRAEVLAALPGVGVKRATTLAGQASLEQLFSMPEEDWQRELGSKTGARVAQFIREGGERVG